MMVDTSVAQQTDVNTFCATENEYWNIIRKKTPPLFSCALFTGVLAGGADSGTADQVGALGRLYGQMIQISDDISDLFKEFVTADWKKKGNNLALIHCLQANYERKHEFNSLHYQWLSK
jgi:geranylgeranyl pyrophosphate synthase